MRFVVKYNCLSAFGREIINPMMLNLHRLLNKWVRLALHGNKPAKKHTYKELLAVHMSK